MTDVLLLGGAGFLGAGLQKALSARKVGFKSVDVDAIDLAGSAELVVPQLCEMLSRSDDVVMLASKIGSKLFESEEAICAAACNKKMNDNVLDAIEAASKAFNKKFAFTYYSTSEMFGSMASADDLIDESTPYKFDFTRKRHLYAYMKLKAEERAEKLLSDGVLSSFKLLRPFNVYGRMQQRGVLFEMVKSAVLENKICFADDTVRTMTRIDLASEMSADAILSDESLKLNVADARCSVTMEMLAKIVNEVLGLDCELVKMLPDDAIQYRSVSEVNSDMTLAKKLIAPEAIALAERLKSA